MNQRLCILPFLLFLIGSLSSKNAMAQANPSPDLPAMVLKKLNEAYFAIVYINDCNQLLLKSPCESNDNWYTMGFRVEGGIRLPKINSYLTTYVKSDLYTERDGHEDVPGLGYLKREIFTEIDELGFKIRPLNVQNKFYGEIGVATGVVNRDRPLRHMALDIQSGMDGNGGYHHYIHQSPKVNVSRGDFIRYLTVSPQISRIIVFYDHERRPIWAKVSLGAEVSTFGPMNNVVQNFTAHIPLIAGKGVISPSLDLKVSEETRVHPSGVAFTPSISLAASLFNRFQLEASTLFPLGAANNEKLTLIKGDDQIEPPLQVKMSWRFQKRSPRRR